MECKGNAKFLLFKKVSAIFILIFYAQCVYKYIPYPIPLCSIAKIALPLQYYKNYAHYFTPIISASTNLYKIPAKHYMILNSKRLYLRTLTLFNTHTKL
jgi:hypothetical protein